MPAGSVPRPDGTFGAARLTPASPFDFDPGAGRHQPVPQSSPFDFASRLPPGGPPQYNGHQDRPPGAWGQMHAAGPPPQAGLPPAWGHPPAGGPPPPGPPPAGPPPGAPPPGPNLDVHSDHTRYFVITSNNKDNVVKSVRHSLWATQRKNEQKLDEAFRYAPAVILIFSYNGSDGFQGYARMRSFIGKPYSRAVDPFNRFGLLFDVEWLRLHDLPYREVDHIRNPLMQDRGVRHCRDGQELSNQCGRSLCGLIDRHINDPESFAAERPRSRSRGRAPALMNQPHAGPEGYYGASGPIPGYAGAFHPQGVPGMPGAPGQKPRASSSESGSERRKKKKKRRKHAPHPLTAGFDEQVEFFSGLDYEEYVQWWRRHSTKSPGPTPPPGTAHLAPPPSLALGGAWVPMPGMVPPPHPYAPQ